MTASQIEAWLKARISEALPSTPEALASERSFASLGLDSLALLTITGDLASWLGRDLPVTVAWENPTIAALAQVLSREAAPAEENVDIRAPDGRPAPLSHAQERMWKDCRSLPTQGPYCLHLRFVLRGVLREEALRRALGELVRRHEILRTTFREVEGEPVQTVHPAGASPLEVRDLRGLSAAEVEAERAAREAEAEAMSLAHGPLFFALLLRLGETEHRLVLTLHHLLCDFQSARLLYRELGALYTAEAEGMAHPLPEPARQVAELAFAERARWRREGVLYARHLAWWLAYWREPLPRRGLSPLRRRRHFPGASLEESYCTRPIPAPTIAQLEALARREETTLYNVLLAAFASVLRQQAGQPRLLLGTYVSTRGREAAQILGLFISLLPLRLELRAAGTFRELLRGVRQATLEANAHQEFPFAELADELRAQGKEPPAPEFIFQLLQSPAGFLQLPGLETEHWPISASPARMPRGLVLTIHERENQFRANLAFDATRYRPARVAAMHRGYLELLETLAAQGDCPLPGPPSGWRRLRLWLTED